MEMLNAQALVGAATGGTRGVVRVETTRDKGADGVRIRTELQHVQVLCFHPC